MDEQNQHAGKPGKPGERGTASHGGTGGEGGAGGAGEDQGGTGGAGGAGGQMGPMGPAGPRGYGNRWGLIGYAILVAGVVFALVLLQRQGDKLELQIEQNAKATSALCAIRADHERSIARTNALLDEHAGDIFGIPRELIVAGLDDDQQTVDALSILDC